MVSSREKSQSLKLTNEQRDSELQQALELRRVDSLIAEHGSLMAHWGPSRQAAQTRLVLMSGVMAGMLSVCAGAKFERYCALLCLSGMLMSVYWLVASLRSYDSMGVRLQHGHSLEMQLAQALRTPELALELNGRTAQDFESLSEQDPDWKGYDKRKRALVAGKGTPQFFTELSLRTTLSQSFRRRARTGRSSNGKKTWEGHLWGWPATACLYFHTLLPLICMASWLIVLCVCLLNPAAAPCGLATDAAPEKVSDEAAVKCTCDSDAYGYATPEYTQYDQEGDRHLLQHWHGRGLM